MCIYNYIHIYIYRYIGMNLCIEWSNNNVNNPHCVTSLETNTQLHVSNTQ